MIVGPNACGKSTLLRALSRVLPPDAGAVVLDGTPVAQMRPKAFARRVGLLAQSSIAPEGITVHELVARGRYPHQSVLHQWSPEDDEAVSEAMDRTDVTGLVPRRVSSLSGGQRQRLALARALLARPGVLILDEFTSHLDPDLDERVRIGVRTYLPQATIIEITHRLQWSEQADHVVVMDAGTVVQAGPPAKLLAEPGPLRTLTARGG